MHNRLSKIFKKKSKTIRIGSLEGERVFLAGSPELAALGKLTMWWGLGLIR